MSRIAICLIFFVFFAALYPRADTAPENVVMEAEQPQLVDPSMFMLFSRMPSAGFPGDLPWYAMWRQSASDAAIGMSLPESDPLVFLRKCLDRYNKEITAYRGTLYKHERVGGRLLRPETVAFDFKENPHSVCMRWVEGAGLARAVLYVANQDQENMQIRPNLPFAPILTKPIHGYEAKNSGRYTIDEFGMKKGLERLIREWTEAREQDDLHAEYEGVYRVARCNDRPCYRIHRSKIKHIGDDGVADAVIYVDVETWLQTGTILLGPEGELIGQYFFRDLELNPTFSANHFGRDLLK